MIISDYTTIKGCSKEYWKLVGGSGLMLLAGLLAFLIIEINGHSITNMTNQIVWGTPHVFAISLLVMASGALNLASMATVFGAAHYKPFRRFSAFLAIALLCGGLAVLMLDLGRPDRLLLTMIHMNFRSMFTWNVFLYSGFVVLCFLYLWAMFEHEEWIKVAGSAAFAGRLILTTGTGSIFGVIHARELFHSAVTAPTFIAVSLTSGTALCLLLLVTTFHYTNRSLDFRLVRGMRNMLIFFTLMVGYLFVIEKFTKFYSPAFYDVERWILAGPYSPLYWIGVIGCGVVVPLALLFHKRIGESTKGIMWASALIIVGEMAFIAHVLIAGQAYPLQLFPGYEAASLFQDGQDGRYFPSIVEIMLGLGGVGIAGLIYLLGLRFFRLLPERVVAPAGWEPWKP
ncbi:MAG: polysulfide reductase NrfD [Magnetococcales bacterium]|nr:polysulfide reductase NrfD [Magnetococcales bacterium]